MARLPVLLLTVLVLMASTQCFGKCLSDSCQGTRSCHPHQKTSSHCSSQSLVADESPAAHHPSGLSALHMTAPLSGAPALSSQSVAPAQSALPPLLVRSITILKI